MTFSTSVEDRFFEDYTPGAVHEFGSMAVEESEMIDFARRFDPQPFHTDPVAAEESVFRRLIASGWYTASVTMRLLVDHYISHVASLGSPGVDELRWLIPVCPGDTLSLRVTLLEARRSSSKPNQGFIRAWTEVLNQQGQVVMTMKSGGFVRSRNADGPVKRPETVPDIAQKSWHSTAVRCLASSRACERPLSFLLEEGEVKVRTILESWREPDHICFKVETEGGLVYVLRYLEYEDSWQVRKSLLQETG